MPVERSFCSSTGNALSSVYSALRTFPSLQGSVPSLLSFITLTGITGMMIRIIGHPPTIDATPGITSPIERKSLMPDAMEPLAISFRIEYLSQYFDPGLTPPEGITRAELENIQVARISQALVIVAYAGSIPRRLGKGANDRELATDKKRARRVAHALEQALDPWCRKKPKLPTDNDDLRIEGAQLIWRNWYEVYMSALDGQAKLLATWAILNQQERWGRSAVVKFNNEKNWVSYAMRD
jgi:hypothetical protein